MKIQDHIIRNFPVFNVDDTLKRVIHFFENTTFSHVAVVEKERFLGVLSETDLETFKEGDIIEEYRYDLDTFYTKKETNWLDVLEAFARNEANILPVLGSKEEVLGYYDLSDVVTEFINTPFFTDPGDILVVARGAKDYSFSEIAQIVESNNAKFIGGFITEMHNDIVQITIKLSAPNINDVVDTFRRYNYNIILGNSEDKFIEELKERSNYLEKYLNV